MENNTATSFPIPTVLEGRNAVPLTDVQMGIWLADHISSQRNTFTIAHKVHINGSLDEHSLLNAIEMGLQEADTINAVYREKEGVPTQKLNECHVQIAPEWMDLSNDGNGKEAMDLLIQQDLDAELTLSSTVPLVRQILIKLSGQRFVWYQRFHHIMLDGFSFNMFTARVASIYK
jgi:hypothetical protein